MFYLQSVRFNYHDLRRHFGTYATQDEAAKVNEAARKYLDRTRNDKLTVREIETNVNQAMAKAQEALEEH